MNVVFVIYVEGMYDNIPSCQTVGIWKSEAQAKLACNKLNKKVKDLSKKCKLWQKKFREEFAKNENKFLSCPYSKTEFYARQNRKNPARDWDEKDVYGLRVSPFSVFLVKKVQLNDT